MKKTFTREELNKIFDKFVPVGKQKLGMMLCKEHRDKIVDELIYFSKVEIKYPKRKIPNNHKDEIEDAYDSGFNDCLDLIYELNEQKENQDIEKCPKCESIFIQQDRITKKLYCLERNCNYRWDEDFKDIEKIKNMYLRASMR